jgi:hypothetical protein
MPLRQEAYLDGAGHGGCIEGLRRSEVTMSKLLAITASLKATLMVASFAFARGDMLPVILISALFSLAPQRDAKPVRQTVGRHKDGLPRDQRSR